MYQSMAQNIAEQRTVKHRHCVLGGRRRRERPASLATRHMGFDRALQLQERNAQMPISIEVLLACEMAGISSS